MRGPGPLPLADASEKGARQVNEPAMHTTLKDLGVGQRGRVVRLDRRGELGQRLAAMGFNRGAIVEVRRVAPLGDPLEVKVRGYRLSLRKKEAEGVVVERMAAAAAGKAG